MGLTASSLNLTQYDVEEVQEKCGGRFNHREIQTLYKRFRSLDKRHKGYLSEDELMSIPELAISPLASRVVQVFQNLNFVDFCRVLAAFSDRATREEKLDFMFRVRARRIRPRLVPRPRLPAKTTRRAPPHSRVPPPPLSRRCTTWTATVSSACPTWRPS